MSTHAPTGPTRVQWTFPLASLLVGFVFFLRDPSDLIATVQHSLLLIYSTFTGDFVNFYQVSIDSTIMPAMYSFLFYALMAVLLLPVAAGFQLFGGFDYADQFQVIFATRVMQLWIIALLCATAFLVYKLGQQMGYRSSRAEWAAYLYLASPLTLFSDAVFWQYDVITIVFVLFAMRFYLQQDFLKFSLVMAVAIACKMFAFFIFVPLIMLVEKRFLHIAKHLLIGVSVTVMTELVARRMPGYDIARQLRSHILSKLTDNGITFSFGLVSLSLIAIVAITIYAYLKSVNDEADFRYTAMYVSFLSIAAPFALFQANTYWWILAMPFGALLIAGHEKVNELMVLMTGFFAFLIVTSVLVFRFYMDQDMVNGGLFAKTFGLRYSGSPSFHSLAHRSGLDHPEMFYAIALAFIFAVLVVLFMPRRHEIYSALAQHDSASEESSVAIAVPTMSTVVLYNAGLYVYILPSLVLFFRELVLK